MWWRRTATDVDPAWGTAIKVTDPNGKVTEANRDALGRLLQVWLPGRAKGTHTPNMEYAYLVRNDGPVALTTRRLIHNGSYLTSVALFDGLLRQRQTQTPSMARQSPGRVIGDIRYDSRGLVVTQNAGWFASGDPGTDLVNPATAVPGRTRVEYDGAARPIVEIFDIAEVEAWRTTTSYRGDRVDVDPPDGGVPTTVIKDARDRTVSFGSTWVAGPPAATRPPCTRTTTRAGSTR